MGRATQEWRRQNIRMCVPISTYRGQNEVGMFHKIGLKKEELVYFGDRNQNLMPFDLFLHYGELKLFSENDTLC